LRLLLQRVSRAAVRVRGEIVAEVAAGYLILVGVGRTERQEDVEWLAQKVAHLRVFEDDRGKMNRSLDEVSGEALVVPQFTLYGDTSRGRRPSWIRAAPPEEARAWVEGFAQALEAEGVPVRRGAFQEHMEVELVNDGPVTLIFERGERGPDAAG
jgi:D-tyrosyl-tRNA(Tyr) deacylase